MDRFSELTLNYSFMWIIVIDFTLWDLHFHIYNSKVGVRTVQIAFWPDFSASCDRSSAGIVYGLLFVFVVGTTEFWTTFVLFRPKKRSKSSRLRLHTACRKLDECRRFLEISIFRPTFIQSGGCSSWPNYNPLTRFKNPTETQFQSFDPEPKL